MGRAQRAALASVAMLGLAACSSGPGADPSPVPALTIVSVVPASGPVAGGTAVTVSGTGFQPSTFVSVGGAYALVESVTATSIRIVAPPHAAGPVSVIVANPDGRSATRAGGFVYLGAAPVLSSVSPRTGYVAGGTPLTLAGSSFRAGATVTVGGLDATVWSVSATSIAILTPAHPTGDVDVTVTNADGQSATIAGGFTYISRPPTNHLVTLTWNANRETAVNQAGGGYKIDMTGQPTITVPWSSGALAPTTTDVVLASGSYTVTITAFAALDAQGGATGSTSAPSQPITVGVP